MTLNQAHVINGTTSGTLTWSTVTASNGAIKYLLCFTNFQSTTKTITFPFPFQNVVDIISGSVLSTALSGATLGLTSIATGTIGSAVNGCAEIFGQ